MCSVYLLDVGYSISMAYKQHNVIMKIIFIFALPVKYNLHPLCINASMSRYTAVGAVSLWSPTAAGVSSRERRWLDTRIGHNFLLRSL